MAGADVELIAEHADQARANGDNGGLPRSRPLTHDPNPRRELKPLDPVGFARSFGAVLYDRAVLEMPLPQRCPSLGEVDPAEPSA